MKFKFLFLGMVAAAAMMSCNNDVIGTGVDDDPNGFKPSTGATTFFAVNLPDKANTRAGESAIIGIPDEKNIGNIAVFVYKVDVGGNMNPENYAYVSTNSTPILLKTTDGTKKVFVALNVGLGTTSSPYLVDYSTMTTTPSGEGATYGVSFNALNRPIWALPGSTPATAALEPGWSTTAPTSGTLSSANGLIRALAGGTATYSMGVLNVAAVTTSSGSRLYSMANWDNTETDTIYTTPFTPSYKSTCQFYFYPDIPKSQLASGTSPSPNGIKNSIEITVQRAVAKALLKITAPNYTDGIAFVTDGEDDDKGAFTVWNPTGAPSTDRGVYSVGNINKVTTIFQKFTSGSVSDDNYTLLTCEPGTSIPAANLAWYQNFDNLRVFGTSMNYRTDPRSSSFTVSSVKANMLAAQGAYNNYNKLGSSSTVADTVYITENAQEYTSGYHDNSTYLIVGGQYAPRYFISDIQQAQVVTNAPIVAYNNRTIPAGTGPGVVVGKELAYAYAPVGYASSPANMDTLYYHVGLKTFFKGKLNVEKYYAWVLNNTQGTYTGSWSTADAALLQGLIEADKTANLLVAYYQGNCFYRVFIADKDPQAKMNERVLVRRNHVYDVQISKIIGPGIADPNDILIPGKPVLPADTYIQVDIKIQDWHKVSQDETVKGE